jgi:hypothetical protein
MCVHGKVLWVRNVPLQGASGGEKVSICHLLSLTRVPLTSKGRWFGLGRTYLNDEVSWLLSAHEDCDSNSY